jgi:xanthine dehydrogenase accessory factor
MPSTDHSRADHVATTLGRLLDLLERGETACLVTVIQSDQSGFPPGTKALFLADGSTDGTLVPAALAGGLAQAVREALAHHRKQAVELSPGLRVFIDVLAPEAELLICGAGHIAVPLAEFARRVGFLVTVLDDRPDFANAARFSGCVVLDEDFAPALRRLPLGANTYVVVITRGHEHDLECLAEILPKPSAYVGLIGSRRRVDFVKIELREKGIPATRLEQLYTPIGLPIGAESPAEIALCIVAELVAVRRLGSDAASELRDERSAGK